MKKIIVLTNHLQNSDGVCRSVISFVNYICTLPDVEVTLRPLFKFDKSMLSLIDKRVIVKPKYKCYLKGSKRLFKLLPKRTLYKMFVKDKYDIEIGYCLIIPHMAIAGSTNKDAKHIIWTHGYEYHEFYNTVDQIVCVSKENQKHMQEDTNNLVKVDYSYNLVNDKMILDLSKEKCDLPEFDGLTIVSVGRMSPEKGFDRLINITSRLVKENFKVRLVLVGDGQLLNNLKNQAKNLGIENNVLFVGSQRNPFKYVVNSDLFVCSSLGEGYSTAMTEALILGVPSVSTLVGGATELVEDAECGEVYENNEEALFLGIKKILENVTILNEWKKILEKTKHKFLRENRQNHIREILDL